MKNTTFLLSAVALLALTGCPKPPVELSSLALSPDLARIPQGETVQFVATALFTDGEVRDVTAEALWSVDDTFVGSASEDSKGLVTGLASGQTVVRARFGGKNVTRSLVVIDAALRELQLDPPHPVVPVGLSVPLKVTAIRSDGSKQDVTAEAIWSSSSPNLASVENAAVIGRVPGALTISASVQGLVVTAPVDVTTARVESIDVQPATECRQVGVGTHPVTAEGAAVHDAGAATGKWPQARKQVAAAGSSARNQQCRRACRSPAPRRG